MLKIEQRSSQAGRIYYENDSNSPVKIIYHLQLLDAINTPHVLDTL